MSYDEILHPCNEFTSIYRPRHEEIATQYFNDIVKQANVDLDANAETVKRRNTELKKLADAEKIVRKYKTIKVFLIIFGIISLAAGLIMGIIGIMNIQTMLWALLAGIGLIALGIVLFVILGVVVSKKLKAADNIANEIRKVVEKLTSEAYQQMFPLNRLLSADVSTMLVEKAMPILDFDTYLDQKRLALMGEKYGLNAQLGADRSILCLKSGELAHSPFMIAKILTHQLGVKTYTGSITITYTVSTGKTTTTRTQTLTASVTKPCPYYYTSTKVIYGNESAPKLSFTRKPSKANGMSDEKIDKMIVKQQKNLKKEAAKQNDKFTEMANSDFEVLFKSLDRDNEVEYRLLFTPLAQIEMVKVIKDDEVGYGDDFYFDKAGMLNILTPEHLDRFDLYANVSNFQHFDYKEIMTKYLNYQKEYFRQIYYSFAPILAIPLYQQHKPLEYIYKGIYDGYLADWQHEAVCNNLPISELKHHLCTTNSILKTHLIAKKNDSDIIAVSASGYQGVPRQTIIYVRGGDGRSHPVPVNWIEYFPVEKTSEVVVKVDEKKVLENEHLFNVREKLLSYFQTHNVSTGGSYFGPALFAFIALKNSGTISDTNVGEALGINVNKK